MPDFEVSPPVMARRPKPLGATTGFFIELLHVVAWCITIIGPFVHQSEVENHAIRVSLDHSGKLPFDEAERQPVPPLSWAVLLVGPCAFALRLLVLRMAELTAETTLLRELTAEQLQNWKDRGATGIAPEGATPSFIQRSDIVAPSIPNAVARATVLEMEEEHLDPKAAVSPPPKYEAQDIDPRQLDRVAAEDLKRFQGRK